MNLIIDIKFDKEIEKIEEWNKVEKINEEELKKYIKKVLEKEYKVVSKNMIYLSLLFTNNNEIKKINKKYRGKDSSTDVISFAYHEAEMGGAFDTLGDIVVSVEKVKEQSKEYNHSFGRELYYVITHGILHLLGYDHLNEIDKKKMRKKEEEILSQYGYRRED